MDSCVSSGPGQAVRRSCAAALKLALLAFATSGFAAEDPDLVVGYAFERLAGARVVDSSASGIDGLRVGSPNLPRQAASKAGFGKALEFDSTQRQYVDAGDPAVLDVDRYTLTAWVRYLPLVHDTRWEVMEKAGAYWMNIRTDSRSLRVGGIYGACSGAGSKWRFVDSVRKIAAGRWTHVASTYDGAVLRLYVNGNLDRTLAVTGRTCSNAMPLTIGSKYRPDLGTLEALFDGRIDDVRVYKRALSGAEIRAVKNSSLE